MYSVEMCQMVMSISVYIDFIVLCDLIGCWFNVDTCDNMAQVRASMDIHGFYDHGWWIAEKQDTTDGPFYGVLHILLDPIRDESIYTGLSDTYGKLLHIATPRRGVGHFFIRTEIGAPGKSYRYKLHKDHMMQPIPLPLMQLKPAFPGFRTAQQWWQGYDEDTKRRRDQVTRICGNLSPQERKHCMAYMARRRAASRIPVSDSGGASGTSTSNPPPVPISVALPFPEETDPLYRCYAFPTNAPPQGPSRPPRVTRETYLPFDRDGRRGREGYRLVMPSQDTPDLSDDEQQPPTSPVDIGGDPAPQRLERVTEVFLPSEVELEGGYIYGRDFRWTVATSKVQQPASK